MAEKKSKSDRDVITEAVLEAANKRIDMMSGAEMKAEADKMMQRGGPGETAGILFEAMDRIKEQAEQYPPGTQRRDEWAQDYNKVRADAAYYTSPDWVPPSMSVERAQEFGPWREGRPISSYDEEGPYPYHGIDKAPRFRHAGVGSNNPGFKWTESPVPPPMLGRMGGDVGNVPPRFRHPNDNQMEEYMRKMGGDVGNVGMLYGRNPPNDNQMEEYLRRLGGDPGNVMFQPPPGPAQEILKGAAGDPGNMTAKEQKAAMKKASKKKVKSKVPDWSEAPNPEDYGRYGQAMYDLAYGQDYQNRIARQKAEDWRFEYKRGKQ